MPKALITGITGQDGSYLAEFLLSKGYEVHGLIRKSSTFNTERIDHIYRDPHDLDSQLFLYYGDLSNSEQLTNLIYNVRPDEIYHMGAQSHVQVSFEMPRVHRRSHWLRDDAYFGRSEAQWNQDPFLSSVFQRDVW